MTGTKPLHVIGVVFLPIVAAFLVASAVGAAEVSATRPYSGDFLHRSTLTGDWGGVRNDLAAKGVTFDMSVTQVGQGVVSGGKDGTWEYGGRGNLTAQADTQKLGLWPGGFLTLEVEGNWEDSVDGNTGSFMPPNSNQLYPVPTGDNLNVPQLSFLQFLSPYFGILAGQLDTTSGDQNEFAHGKGDTQFMNLALSYNPTPLAGVPYSALGAGLVVLPTKDPQAAILTASVVQQNGTSTRPAFDDLTTNKLTFAGEGRVRTDFFGRTGHQLVGALYCNAELASLDQRVGFVLQNQRFEREPGTWAVYYNFDQYVYELEKGSGRGVGLFGRFGASDGNPNPLHYFYSLGVGGRGPVAARPDDRFGLGYYYLDVKNPTLTTFRQTRSFLRDEWGFEAFYNVAITPWLLLTPDLQVIGPTQKQTLLPITNRKRVDTAVALGFRVQVVF